MAKGKETQEDRNARILEADKTNNAPGNITQVAGEPVDTGTGEVLADAGDGKPDQGSLLGAKDGARGDDVEPQQGPPDPIQFQTRHDVGLIRTALTGRAADLKKMSEKVTGEGYPREARVILGDSATIEHRILPLLKGQAELPLGNTETIRSMVGERLIDLIEKARKGRWTDAQVVEAIARRVAVMLEAAEGAGWSAGYADRAMLTPATVVVQAIATIPPKVWEDVG